MATVGRKHKRAKKNQTPEAEFTSNLNFYSKSKDLKSSITLYTNAISQNLNISQHHYSSLLYLCSASLTDPSTKDLAIQHGFSIYDRMVSSGVKPNEASVTSVARLAAAKGDGDFGFDLIKRMELYELKPRLRTYDPVLSCFCEKLEADKAYDVEKHMGLMAVNLEEDEIVMLLMLSAEIGNSERVYRYLLKLKNVVSGVKEEGVRVIEDWFRKFEDDGVELDLKLIRETIVRNGGGWHGLGWIGKGKWVVNRGSVDLGGKCCSCGERLMAIDIDDMETERFAGSVAGLALEREVKANFSEFQNWLEDHSNYEAIVDGANIGLYQQNFEEGGFSGSQLDAVVKELYNRHRKWPLIVLHIKRVRALMQNPNHRNLVLEWTANNALYTTPHGSNDDWYWLYAAIKLRCLLVTNDEMRDHIFELLGSGFFLKWKERHQVRYTFLKGVFLKLQMPPPYSIAIQESETGSWHVPIACEENGESARSWLCATRKTTPRNSE